MSIIVNSLLDNPYNNSKEYHEIADQKDFGFNGKKYHKITYEKNLGVIHRLFVGALAGLALAFIAIASLIFFFNVPCVPEKVSLWWQQAKSGVDQQVVLIPLEKT